MSQRLTPSSLNLLAALCLLAALLMAMAPVAPVSQNVGAGGGPRDLPEGYAERAMAHVERLASAPHPIGSPANHAARDYITAQLREAGLDVTVQRELVVNRHHRGQPRFAVVENIVAQRQGSRPGQALMLMTHYDSVAWSPGAADAASGVATLLEAARELARQPTPRNDLLILFTDGEEVGLMGAQAFFATHPRAAEVALVLNFDSRGSRGPAMMFQSSPGNTALIEALATEVSQPFASSLAQTAYELMPNDTDLSIALGKGKAGMNFAFVEGFFDYHSATDTAEHLSAATLEHLGSYALPLARHFLDADLTATGGVAQRYFNLPGGTFVAYPAWVDAVLLAIGLLLVGLALARAKRAGAWSGREFVLAAGAVLAALLLPAVVISALYRLYFGWFGNAFELIGIAAQLRLWFALWAALALGLALWVLGRAGSGLGWRWAVLIGLLPAALPLLGGELWMPALLGGLTSALLLLALRRPLPAEALIAAALLLFALVTVALLAMAAGAASFFVICLVLAAGLQAVRWWRRAPLPGAAWLVLALPVGALMGDLALKFDSAIGYAVPAAAVAPLLLWLLLCAPLGVGPGARRTGAAVAAIAVVATAVLSAQSPFDARHPRPTALYLLQDADRSLSWWATHETDRDPWYATVLGEAPAELTDVDYLPGSGIQTWAAPVAAEIVSMPRVEEFSEAVEGGERRLRFRLRVDGPSEYVNLFLPASAALRRLAVDGLEVELPAAVQAGNPWPWRLRGYAMPSEGVEITAWLAETGTLPAVRVTSVSYAQPPGLVIPPRPATLMRGIDPFSDATVTTRLIPLTVAPPRDEGGAEPGDAGSAAAPAEGTPAAPARQAATP